MSAPAVPQAGPSGRRIPLVLRWTVLAVAVIGALALLMPGISTAAGARLNVFTTPVVAVGSGILLTLAARKCRGRERWAWATIGSGVLCWSIGETIWQGYIFFDLAVPYPGMADVFYLLGYPLLGAGVLMLPHLQGGRWERLRVSLDAVVGALAISVVMWLTYLGRVVTIDYGVGFLENAINAFYPAADIVLLVAIMLLALRRAEYRLDPRLLWLVVGLVTTAAADMVYYIQIDAGSYEDGGWLDAIWLLSYAGFALCARAVGRPRAQPSVDPGPTHWWRRVPPYGAAAVLFGLSLYRVEGANLVLNWAFTVVVVLIVARQAIAIRENRDLVAKHRDELLSSVSHEIRTPLTAVQGYAQLLSEDWMALDDADKREMVSIIDAQAVQLNRIATDLIEVARDRLGSVKLAREDRPLTGIIHEALDSLPTRTRDRITVETDGDPVLSADPGRLRQVLVNLLTNAERYGKNRILLAVRTLERAVIFAVHDDGPGVPRKYEAAIWERFERGAHRHDSRTPGSGIGLSIARALVQAHGGTIRQHRSDRYGGACFEFTIPLTESPAAPRTHRAPAGAELAPASAGNPAA